VTRICNGRSSSTLSEWSAEREAASPSGTRTPLSPFAELWDGVSGLAETLSAETNPGDLIGILLPACPMFPLAMLACLAAGRPFVALDAHYPPDWLDHVLQDARPTLIVTLEDGLPGLEARMPTLRVIRLTGLPGSAHRGWRPATMGVDEPLTIHVLLAAVLPDVNRSSGFVHAIVAGRQPLCADPGKPVRRMTRSVGIRASTQGGHPPA